jgi:hypothetical protein
MSPFEALYGRKCNTPISWDNPADREVVGPEFLREMQENMLKIKKNLKYSKDMKKTYTDKGIIQREFCIGYHVLLKLEANGSSLKLGNCSKLAARYYGPFEILEGLDRTTFIRFNAIR